MSDHFSKLPGVTPSDTEGKKQWFCLRSQPKHEHIAAAHLRKIEGVEVFCPRIKYKKATRTGPAWFTEALFPNYLFAKFDPEPHKVQVRYTSGVCTILRFGMSEAYVPEETILSLRQGLDDTEIRVIPEVPEVGDQVTIASGAFRGLLAVVRQVMPAKERVRLLLDFLGRPQEVDLAYSEVVLPGGEARKR